MNTPNPEWVKRIFISAAKHFKLVANTNSIPFHLRGTTRDTSIHDEYIEFYMDEPHIQQISNNVFRIVVGINVIYSVDYSSNKYRPLDITGIILDAFSEICVYDSYDNYLGRMLPLDSGITVNNFGDMDDKVKINSGSVEAVYEIYLPN